MEDKAAESDSACDPLVTGASRAQGIVGDAMAEQLWWGQGSGVSSPDNGLLPGQRHRWSTEVGKLGEGTGENEKT